MSATNGFDAGALISGPLGRPQVPLGALSVPARPVPWQAQGSDLGNLSGLGPLLRAQHTPAGHEPLARLTEVESRGREAIATPGRVVQVVEIKKLAGLAGVKLYPPRRDQDAFRWTRQSDPDVASLPTPIGGAFGKGGATGAPGAAHTGTAGLLMEHYHRALMHRGRVAVLGPEQVNAILVAYEREAVVRAAAEAARVAAAGGLGARDPQNPAWVNFLAAMDGPHRRTFVDVDAGGRVRRTVVAESAYRPAPSPAEAVREFVYDGVVHHEMGDPRTMAGSAATKPTQLVTQWSGHHLHDLVGHPTALVTPGAVLHYCVRRVKVPLTHDMTFVLHRNGAGGEGTMDEPRTIELRSLQNLLPTGPGWDAAIYPNQFSVVANEEAGALPASFARYPTYAGREHYDGVSFSFARITAPSSVQTLGAGVGSNPYLPAVGIDDAARVPRNARVSGMRPIEVLMHYGTGSKFADIPF